MTVTRRELLKIAGLAAGSLPLAGCERLISRITGEMGQSIPSRIAVADSHEIDPDFHLLSRAAYGPWPGDLDRIRGMGPDAWLDEQLAPALIDDTACDLRARRFETPQLDPGTCYEFKKPVLREEIVRHTVLRAVYSKRQLLEVMTGFWTDHLNINLDKGDCVYLKPADDRTVVRAHALGRFRDLIGASAISPAMLVYLDGKENKKSSPSEKPNENYARELMELHTLGVAGGYSQDDVYEAARALTGWRLRAKWGRGSVYFDPAFHDDGAKRVLGNLIPAGRGAKDLDDVLDIVCNHPATARHIAGKLVRRFVSDDPPASLVDRAAAEFTASGGSIKPVLSLIFRSPEFKAAAGAKIKRPFDFIVSALRGVGADTHAHSDLIQLLSRMGQAPFQYPTPDGYPDKPAPWLGTMLWRWNFAVALGSGTLPGAAVSIDRLAAATNATTSQATDASRLFAHLIGRRATPQEVKALDEFAKNFAKADDPAGALTGLVLAGPAFQRH